MDLNFLGTVIELGFLALMFGAFLGFAAKKFAVEVDERVEKVGSVLPNANCGACGYPGGCSGFAKAVVSGEAAVNACIPGGSAVASAIAEILGTEAGNSVKVVAALKCRGGKSRAKDKYQYDGIHDCRAAVLVTDGPKLCPNACIGLGTCAEVCPFDAITMGPEDLPIISDAKCTGCGACISACPKGVLELIPLKNQVWVACNNILPGKNVKNACETGCIACRLCEKNCPVNAITIENNLAHIDYSKCTNCQICVVVCPTGTIHTKKSGEVSNDAPKIRAALERKKAKEKERKKALTEAKNKEE
ncbi:Fe-S cluster domain-containing protein [bacterium]|nr:Fe-S cluster domain-containing protein [bacterium]